MHSSKFISGKETPLKWILRIGSGDAIDMKKVSTEKETGFEVPVIGGNGLMGYTELSNTKEDTLIIGRVGAHCGNIHYIKERSWVTDNALRIRLSTIEINHEFLKYSLIALGLNQFANRNAQPLITGEIVKSKSILLATPEEQEIIAQFLDEKISQIDKLIEQKEKLLKLLTEKRTAIITKAVTKGLDPTVEMKDSGIDWLGEIPKEWKIKPLKFVVNLINEKIDDLGDFTYLGLENIESWTTKRIVDEDATAEGVVTKFQPNDVLFGKLRPYLAKVYLADFEGGASTEALILRSGSEVVPAFLKYYLVSDLLIDVINSSSYGTKMPRASWNFMGRLPMVLPTIEIQNDIVNYLTIKIEKFDFSILTITKSINQLKEYRDALITSAVTGQIDVSK